MLLRLKCISQSLPLLLFVVLAKKVKQNSIPFQVIELIIGILSLGIDLDFHLFARQRKVSAFVQGIILLLSEKYSYIH